MSEPSHENEGALRVKCDVCPHECNIAPGKVGICGARANVDGVIRSLNYGQATALALDPIEKKPLAMFKPGSKVLSYGSYGCNLRCQFCQNSDISMEAVRSCTLRPDIQTRYIPADSLVEQAVLLADQGNIGVALTYNEPMIAPEYLMDVGSALKEAGMDLVVVTNGYSSSAIWDASLELTSAMNIDLKCFSESGYASVGAPDGLATVLRNIEAAYDAGVHVELTTLIVPGLSDNEDEFKAECEWIASISPSIPLHLSRFFPQYKMVDERPTDLELMMRFKDIADMRLEHVFLGNV